MQEFFLDIRNLGVTVQPTFKFGFIGAINPSEIRFQRMKSSRGEDEIRLRRMKSALRAGCGTDPSGLFIKIQF